MYNLSSVGRVLIGHVLVALLRTGQEGIRQRPQYDYHCPRRRCEHMFFLPSFGHAHVLTWVSSAWAAEKGMVRLPSSIC